MDLQLITKGVYIRCVAFRVFKVIMMTVVNIYPVPNLNYMLVTLLTRLMMDHCSEPSISRLLRLSSTPGYSHPTLYELF